MERIKLNLFIPVIGIMILVTGCCSTSPPVGRTDSEIYVPNRAEDINPIMTGQLMPDLVLLTEDSTKFNLTSVLSDNPTVIVFYRGGWCPYCTKHLTELQEIYSQLNEDGYQFFAISPDRPQKLRERKSESDLEFTLLSDSDMKASIALGIAYRMAGPMVDTYRTKYKIDLEDASGYAHHLLPVPSVFIIGTDGIIQFSYVNPDYKVRIDPDYLVTVAHAVKVQHAARELQINTNSASKEPADGAGAIHQ